MSPAVWVGVTLIGGAGAVLRSTVDGAIAERLGREFPYGTLAINLSGAFILGILTGLSLSATESLLEGTAAVGSYTTFSTWMLESQRLGEERAWGLVAANVLVSLVVGVAAAALGRWIGAQL